MSEQVVCASCGNIGQSKKLYKGNGKTDIALWLTLGLIGLFLFWPVFFIPLTYSLWRSFSSYKGCPECKSSDVISVNSPRGKKLVEEFSEQE